MEEQEEFKKVTLLDQLSIAVSSPKNYRHLVFRKKGRLVLFVVVLSFLLAFIEFGIDTIFWINKVGGLVIWPRMKSRHLSIRMAGLL